MPKIELTKKDLSNTSGGISQNDGHKLANLLSYYYQQGRLNLDSSEYDYIYQVFESGNDSEIIEVFKNYAKSSNIAWIEMASLYNSFTK